MKLVAGSMLLAGLAVAAAPPTYDWGDDTSELSQKLQESKALCRAVRTREPPAADRPDARTAAALKGCDSEALYYGIGIKADPVKARQCAFLERDAGDEGVMAGSTMLMTIYANGLGAKRDLDVATHLACGIEGSVMESDGRVLHLAELKAKQWSGSDFHFCDDITSGLAMGYCSAHSARIDGAKRDAALSALIGRWSPAERQAFAKLQQAQTAFVDAHGQGEVDLSGTARAAMQIASEERLKRDFLDTLQRLSSGKAPAFSTAQYRTADARLNAAYRKALAGLEGEDFPGAVTRTGIRDAQRA